MADDLNAVIPQKITMKVIVEDVNGNDEEEVVTIRQVKMKQLSDMLRLAAPLMPAMKDPKKFDPMKLYAEYPDAVMQLIAVACRRPPEWVHSMDPVSAVDLFGRLVEVNLDFFIKNILPAVYRAIGHIQSIRVVQEALVGQKASTS